jgi:hypothetical protein
MNHVARRDASHFDVFGASTVIEPHSVDLAIASSLQIFSVSVSI